MAPLGAIPIAEFVAAEGVGVPSGWRLRRIDRRYLRPVDGWIDVLMPTRGDVMAPLGAIPIAEFVAAEGVGIPSGRRLLRHGRRLAAAGSNRPKSGDCWFARASDLHVANCPAIRLNRDGDYPAVNCCATSA